MADRAHAPPRRAEWLLAALAALLLAAWPLRAGLLDGDRVLFAVDTATVQEPWAGALRDAGTPAPAAPRQDGLADQGVFFYPVHRFVVESWLAGDPPFWNPWIYAGVPSAGNPQNGVFDPQVLVLALFEAVGGRALFDRGLAWLAWLRLAAAGLGAFALARRLGLGPSGAAIAGLGFGGSGFLVLWVNASPGHVAPFLPWLLFALEGTRGPRPGRSAAWAALLFCGALLGGHPETAFGIGAAAGLWTLALGRAGGSRGEGKRARHGRTGRAREDRSRAGRWSFLGLLLGTALASIALVPFLEYLRHSGALLARQLARVDHSVDLVALGALAIGWGIALQGRGALRASGEHVGGRAEWRGLAVGLALAAVTAVLAARGLGRAAALVFLPDLYGLPGGADYSGPGDYLELASGWVPWPVLPLAAASVLGARPRVGGLARRPLIVGLAAVALLSVLAAPGIADLWRALPLVGLGATARFGAVSALGLALLAGEGLERSERPGRVAAVALALGWLALTFHHTPPAALPSALTRGDPADEVAQVLRRPPATMSSGRLEVTGWLHRDPPVVSTRLRVEGLDATGGVRADAVHTLPAELAEVPWPELTPSERAQAPDGARFFRAQGLDVRHLDEGSWRLVAEFVGANGVALGERSAGVVRVVRAPRTRLRTAIVLVLALIVMLVLPRGTPAAVLLIGMAVFQVLDFAEGKNPAVPRAECFPPTRTEEVLGDVLGHHRFFAAPGILPANTGLLSRLRDLDGYDALDVASFDLYRPYALRPGTQPLLGWNAYGADLESPAFELLGVGALVTPRPFAAPGWETVAGPVGAPREAEVFVTRALDPLPRAFCVSRRVEREEVLADLAAFDPRRSFFLEDGEAWAPAAPFEQAEVTLRSSSNGRVSLHASLDGDGLLVLTDQDFAGWRVEVDGEPGRILRTNALFRGVPLAAGDHRVVFHYNPLSLRIGAALTALALLAILIAAWR